MATLSNKEVYELVIGGGLRGSTGKLSGGRFYYNDSDGMYELQDIPQVEAQISEGQFLATGTTKSYILGSPSSPYFVAPGDVQLPEVNNKHVKALCVGYQCVEAPPGSPDQYSSYNIVIDYIADDGTIAGSNVIECKHLFENSGAEVVNLAYGGWLRDGTYGSGFVGIATATEGHPREYYTANETISSGADNVFYCSYWGVGQKPMEDDGVAPTGGSGGGGGSYSRPDEAVPIPGLPTYSIADIGTTGVFECSPMSLSSFTNFLWSDNFFDNIIKNQRAPLDNVISLAMMPRMELTGETASIIVGNLDSECSGLKLSTTYYQLNCGTINVTEYYRNFADYHTQIQIYLPFCGVFDLPVNDVMDGSVGVYYNVDVFSGACVAFVTCNTNGVWHVLQQHNGNIKTELPLSSNNWMQYYTGLAGVIGSAMSKDVGGAVNSFANMKINYQRAGNIGSTVGLMSVRYPYLIFTTPQIFTANGFKDSRGYVSNLSGTIQSFINAKQKPSDVAYIQADTNKLDLTDLVITDEERTMLYTMLEEGIYI